MGSKIQSDLQLNSNFEIIKVRGLSRALDHIWMGLWHGYPPSLPLIGLSLMAVLAMAMPTIYIFIRAIQGGWETWARLLNTRIPTLLFNTTKLTGAVTFSSVVIGVTVAWLIIRTDLPLRRLWKWAMAMPLLIPPYVGALTYIIIFGPVGLLKQQTGRIFIDIYSLQGAILVFTAFTFPYVYLVVASALSKINLNYEEAALSCGVGYKKLFFKVILPLLRPSIGGGALLVALYVLSDFGAIAMLRFSTLSSTIFYQISGRFDRSGAAIISVILILINMLLLFINSIGHNSIKYQQNSRSNRIATTIALKKWKIPALILVIIIFFVSVVLPIALLVYWSSKGVMMGVLNQRFWGFTWNSIKISLQAAGLCMILSVPVAYLKSRHKSKISSIIYQTVYSGYVIPGVIVALGIIFIVNRFLPWLYATPAMILLAYIIRFLPQNLQASDGVLAMVSPKLDEAAKSLGKKQWQVILKVIAPIISPGILAGGAMVFVSAIKELPTTMLLRPAGFDTLAVRIWLEAHEGFYYAAAPAAMLIIMVSIIPLRWMLKKI